jgi:hypothetical protein
MDVPRRYLIALMLLASVGGSSCALAAPPLRQFVFTVFSAEPVGRLMYVPRPEAAPLPLAFYPTARSPRYAYTGPETVQLFDAVTGAVVAEVSVPSAIRSALFIVSAIDRPAATNLRYRVQVLDDGATQHPPGTLRILNLSGLPLSGTINGRPLTLKDGMNAPLRVGASAEVRLRTRFRDRSYQAYAETIALDDSGRALLLLLPPYRQGSLEMQSRVLRDAPVPAARDAGR